MKAKTAITSKKIREGKINILYNLRLKAGYSVKKVCESVNVSSSMIYQIENGTRIPSSKLAGKLADFYECTLDDIYNRNRTGKQESIKT